MHDTWARGSAARSARRSPLRLDRARLARGHRRNRRRGSRGLYLLLDQLEAYFVHHGGDPALADAIVDLLARPELPVHLLLAIREDALARLDAFKGQLPGLLANRLRLDHLTSAAGRRAIDGPVERLGELAPEEGTSPSSRSSSRPCSTGSGRELWSAGARSRRREGRPRAGRIETPYLQLVMQRLWEVERGDGLGVLRLSTLEELGGPARIVETISSARSPLSRRRRSSRRGSSTSS